MTEILWDPALTPPAELQQEDLDALAAWDAAGMIVGPGEDLAQYRERLLARFAAEQELYDALAQDGKAEVFDGIEVRQEDRIPTEILQEAADLTQELYGFEVRHFPGFFLSKDVGLLWGGCMISDTELPLAMFLIRSSFRNKERFFIYNRRELQAHELCHFARKEFKDVFLDEFFAYQTSPSGLRRYLGNCFIHQRDALYFMIPALVLLLAQSLQFFVWHHFQAEWFWIPAIGMPMYLLWRNEWSRRGYFRAVKTLRKFGVTAAEKVLFRATPAERRELGAIRSAEELQEYLAAHQQTELRWRVIAHRFLKKEEPSA